MMGIKSLTNFLETMKRITYIIIATLLSVSCEIDNIGPLLTDLDIIFFLEEGIEVKEDSKESIVIEIGSTKGGNTSQLTLGGTAKEGVDYVVKGDLNLAFAKGVYITSISISLIDNTNVDDDHTIIVSLPEGQGYSENNKREYVINIINDEVNFGTVISVISASNNDVEEGETGQMGLSSSDLEFGEFDTSGTPDFGIQTIGLRFTDIDIPTGGAVTITNARIQFTADNTGSNPVQLTLYGENTGNASEYTLDDFNVTSRVKTSTNVVWDVPAWLVRQEKGSNQKTVDISAIIQEILNRGDWVKGNAINIIMEHSGPSIGVTSSSGGREAETFDGTGGGVDAPVLTIDWER